MLLALAVFSAACGSKKQANDGPTCAQVTDRMVEIMKSGPTGHGSVELGNRDQMIETCERKKLSPAQRTCMVNAKDVVTLANCSAPPRTPTAPAPSPTPTPAATGSGSGS